MQRSQAVIFLAVIFLGGMFFMTACDGGNGAEDGDETPTPSAPNAPTIEEIYSENREVAVLWDVINTADTYNLYWNTTGGVTKSDSSVTNLHAPYYVHTGLCLFKTYSYAATAVNAGGESGLSNEVSALPVDIPEELQKKLSSDAAAGDFLACSVDISGDYAVAGAMYKMSAGFARGAAYVFSRNYGGQNNWGQVAKLTALDAESGDEFGRSVAISGDVIVVGAHREDGSGVDWGAAYIYARNQGGTDNWGQVMKITASTPESNAQFGYSVAIDGDYAVVGALYEDGGGLAVDRGAAYVFDRNQGGTDNWGQVAKLVALDAEDSDYFGSSVSIDGDCAIVGAHYEDGGGADRGAAYIFDRNQGGADNWGQVAKLIASDTSDSDRLGISVDISGDYAVVGTTYKDDGGNNRGAAYIYGRDEGGADNWGEVVILTASDAEDSDYFGCSVSIDGDYVLIGALYEDGGGVNYGAAYIYGRNYGGQDNWGEMMKLTASDAENGDQFGLSVSIDGDYALVGATFEDDGGSDSGAIYIF